MADYSAFYFNYMSAKYIKYFPKPFLEDLTEFLQKLNLRQFSTFSHLNIPLNYLSSYQLMTLNNISVPFLDLQWSIYE